MFHPVGTQPPSVYWRRRLFLFGSLVLVLVLAVLTINAVRSSGNGRADAGSPATSTSSPAPSSRTTPSAPRRSSAPSSSARSKKSSAAGSSTTREPPTASTQPAADCAASDLKLNSVAGKSSYQVGDTPLLQLQVTNIGPQPCVQNLADKQVEMRVYNGESRIWGSHDCKVEPGTTDRTLTPKVSVLVSIKWSGLTSKPGCGGTRQRVGPGTYTLYSALAGHQAHAGQFTFG